MKMHELHGQGVHATYTEGSLPSISLCVQNESVEEFKRLVAKGLNTWDTCPLWMIQLSAMLNNVPAPFSARDAKIPLASNPT